MRERILTEIRRLADLNGGQPPGRQVFEAETGIRYSEWYGIHWARWGDAIIEAGFVPNTIQAKLDRGILLRQLAEGYRHFGRVATDGELGLYGRSHPDFPSHSTISNHFAGKGNLTAAVRAWASEHEEFADIVALLPDISTSSPKGRPSSRGTDQCT